MQFLDLRAVEFAVMVLVHRVKARRAAAELGLRDHTVTVGIVLPEENAVELVAVAATRSRVRGWSIGGRSERRVVGFRAGSAGEREQAEE